MLNSVISQGMTLPSFLLCIGVALVFGILTALCFTFHGQHSGSLSLSIALLPPVVALIIMLVNGNVGAGLAVAGAFALVRFRSVPGTAKEITGLFTSVALGLACGMGYLGIAALFFLIMAAAVLALGALHFGTSSVQRSLKITVPEDLDYDGAFDDILDEYTESYELSRVKTTNLGTLFELSYDIRLKKGQPSKAFLDALRSRNGNLAISVSRDFDRDSM